MNIKLIGIDIDGTLLTSDKRLTAETVAALRDAADRGIQVVISTGRFLSEFTDLLQQLPMVRYTVTCTGSQVLDLKTGETLFRKALTAAELQRFHRLLLPFDMMMEVFSDLDGCIHNRRRDLDRGERFCPPALAANLRKTHIPEDDLDEYVANYHGLTNKIHMFFASAEERDRAWDLLRDEPYEIMDTMDRDLEIMPPGVDKGSGLQALAEHLGLTPDQVMAIGDGGNDVGMLRYAGHSVAMANGSHSAKAAAKFLTDTNDNDGVAKAIRRIFS